MRAHLLLKTCSSVIFNKTGELIVSLGSLLFFLLLFDLSSCGVELSEGIQVHRIFRIFFWQPIEMIVLSVEDKP